MNYYAQGGQAHGLKSIAKELASYGRGGDTMLAHINPQEAAVLKAMGGSGTINPHTGLPEFLFGFKVPIVDDIIHGVKSLVQDLGPVATIAGGYFGGPLGAAIVGGLQGEKGFDLKRAMLSGALAYGAQNLAGGLSDAGAAGSTATAGDVAAKLGVEGAATGAGSQAAMLAEQSAGLGDAGLRNIASSASYGTTPTMAGTVGSTAADFGSKATDVGRGIYNLATNQPGAVDAFKASGATLTNTALPIYGGVTGTMALDEAEKMKNAADEARALSDADLAAQQNRIEESRKRGLASMISNPYMFAYGGPVDDESGVDDLGLAQGNMKNGLFAGGVPSYAKGGQPKFLSGGGDGMSDSIPATINGNQPARLADGEFVKPADVVSHLGNGSSKAGAKQLYSMMDKVRTARTGTKKQGKQINPARFMPA